MSNDEKVGLFAAVSGIIAVMTKPLPSQEKLREMLDYDLSTGILRWRKYGKSPRFAGRVAGSVAVRGERSYLVVDIGGSPRYAHRVAYKWMTGEEPPLVDHKNGDGLDNRFENLRAATDLQNQGNRRVRKNAQTGRKCVRRMGNKFAAYIVHRGSYIHLGTFETADKATAAYLLAARSYFGEFAQAG